MVLDWKSFFTIWYRKRGSEGQFLGLSPEKPVPEVFRSAHGCFVYRNGLKVNPLELDSYLEFLIQHWSAATNWEGIRNLVRALTIIWIPECIDTSEHSFIVEGLAILSSYTIFIKWEEDINMTALGHELGHFILTHWKNDSSEEGLEDFAAFHRLPF